MENTWRDDEYEEESDGTEVVYDNESGIFWKKTWMKLGYLAHPKRRHKNCWPYVIDTFDMNTATVLANLFAHMSLLHDIDTKRAD